MTTTATNHDLSPSASTATCSAAILELRITAETTTILEHLRLLQLHTYSAREPLYAKMEAWYLLTLSKIRTTLH
jgi:hypothetical protein